MEIVVLGTGCPNCKTTYDRVAKVIEGMENKPTLRKEEDILEIVKYNIMSLPAVVVRIVPILIILCILILIHIVIIVVIHNEKLLSCFLRRILPVNCVQIVTKFCKFCKSLLNGNAIFL